MRANHHSTGFQLSGSKLQAQRNTQQQQQQQQQQQKQQQQQPQQMRQQRRQQPAPCQKTLRKPH
jgi:hypothetical protein